VERAHPVFWSSMFLCDQMCDVVGKGSGSTRTHFSNFGEYH